MDLIEQTIREAVEEARGEAEIAKKVFWRTANAKRAAFLPEFLRLGEGLLYGSETIKIARQALVDAKGDPEALGRSLAERSDPREFPGDNATVLTEVVRRVAPGINDSIERYAEEWRTENNAGR